MSDPAEGDQRELEAIQRQLADTRQHIDELEALIGELPEIYERKFEQQLQPLLEQERLLRQQNLLLRDQLQRSLPAAAPGSPADGAGPARAQELLVIARGPSWVELRDSQWRSVYRALLRGRKRFNLGAGLSLKAGRPKLLRVQLGSGPARALPPRKWGTWHHFQPPGA